MQVHRLPIFTDNYVFVLEGTDQTAAVVDPGSATACLNFLASHRLNLTAILVTHHHPDHINGVKDLLAVFPQAMVYGGRHDRGRIPSQEVELDGGDRLTVVGETAEVLFVPGHTKAHIAYYFPRQKHLFCGDTLFGGGCGRLFEGTPSQMVTSLDQLRQLPDDTKVWCAHEYTLSNLRFALTVDPSNDDLQHRWQTAQITRQQGEATVPSTIGLEKKTNPFLRWEAPAMQAATGHTSPDRVFGKLRGMKDLF